jgi:hypothetical protein
MKSIWISRLMINLSKKSRLEGRITIGVGAKVWKQWISMRILSQKKLWVRNKQSWKSHYAQTACLTALNLKKAKKIKKKLDS